MKAIFHYFCAMFSKLKHIVLWLLALFVAMLLQRCANAVAPTGGPKDTTPPMVVESVPENRSTAFSGQKIELSFDEYVTLENANQNVLFSPPLASKPDIKLQGKTLVIKFKESLQPNTTYTIHFGEAIKDLHEGNVFKNFVYSFSTGHHIDTLSIAGVVLNAMDKQPVEKAYVGLYAADRDQLDSLPMTTAPNYITKTDKEGRFSLEGLADKDYLVFALKDVNANLFFDLPNEEVAFLDSLVHPNDSLPLSLYLFAEIDSTQMLLEKKLVEEGLLRFVFRHPAHDAVVMTPEMLPDSFNLVTQTSPNYDTICWYFTPNVKDSLWVQVKLDTLINDSSRYSLKYKEQNPRRNRAPESIKVTQNLVGQGGLVAGHDLILTFSEPVVRYEMRDSAVFRRDTIAYYNELAFEPADEHGLKYKLLNRIENNVNYRIEIPDSVFFGIRNRTNAPIKLDFHLLKDEEYGNIYITVAPPEGMRQVVVQLTDESGKTTLKEEIITKRQEVMFEHLAPAKYKLRAILDADGNGKWSTGNYVRRILPETVIEYKNPLEIKAGWDIDLEEVWELR